MSARLTPLARLAAIVLVLQFMASEASAQVAPKVVLAGHTGRVTALAIDPTGQTLASASLDRTIRLWDTNTCRELKTLRGHLGEVNCLAFAGSKLVSGSSDMSIRVWQVPGDGVMTLRAHEAPVVALAPGVAGRSFMSSAADGVIKLWDTAGGTERGLVRATSADVSSALAFSPDGKLLAWAEGSAVRVAEAETRQRLATLSGHVSAVSAVLFAPGSSDLLSAGFDNTVRAWDPRSGAVKGILFRGQSGVCALACRGDGKLLAAAELTGSVSLVELPGGNLPTRLSAPPGAAAILFSRAGRLLFGGHADGTIRIWQLQAGNWPASPTAGAVAGGAIAAPAVPAAPFAPAPRQDARAVQALRRLGADVHSDGDNVLWVDFKHKPTRDESLAYLEGLPHLEWLDLAKTGVGDAGLAHLKGLRRLKKLDLSGTEASDASVPVLKQLTSLETLDVSATMMTDAGLAQLRSLPNLKNLVAAAVRWRIEARPHQGRLMLDMDGVRLLLDEASGKRRASLGQVQVAGPGRSGGHWRTAGAEVQAEYANGVARLTITAGARTYAVEFSGNGTRMSVNGGRAFVLSGEKKTFSLRPAGVRLERD